MKQSGPFRGRVAGRFPKIPSVFPRGPSEGQKGVLRVVTGNPLILVDSTCYRPGLERLA